MQATPEASNLLLYRLLWASDSATQNAILFVLAAALLAFFAVYLPLAIRLVRTGLLNRSVRDACHADDRPAEEHRREITRAFATSPLAWHWEEFLYRWQSSQTGGQREQAPVRLLEIFDQRPLLPTGARSSLLPALPGLFLAIGVLGTFVGLTSAVSAADAGDASTTLLADQIGLALRTSLWGLLLAIASALGGRVLEGRFERYAESLDLWVERAYGSVSVGEFANISAQAQRDALSGLGTELTRFTTDLGERMDRGLSRIEHSTATAAQLVSEEQRGALQTVVRELSLQVQRGVEDHLTELHSMLERAVDHQGAVTGGLAEAFEQMSANAESHMRVTQVLQDAATSVEGAAGSLSGTAHDMNPVLEHLRETGRSLQTTAGTMQSTQEVVSHSAEGIRSSLNHATAAMDEQREFIDSSLTEIRTTLEVLSTSLGENLNRALRSVDEALAHTVGRLRETITDSNETIDRMALPVRAAEGTTREMQTALERVREEIVALGDWLGQAVRPVRSSLTQLEERSAEITRVLVQFGDRAQGVDKTMDALRGEIHEEGRRVRASQSELGRHLSRTSESLETLDRSTREIRIPASPAGVSWTATQLRSLAEPAAELPQAGDTRPASPSESTAEPTPASATEAPTEASAAGPETIEVERAPLEPTDSPDPAESPSEPSETTPTEPVITVDAKDPTPVPTQAGAAEPDAPPAKAKHVPPVASPDPGATEAVARAEPAAAVAIDAGGAAPPKKKPKARRPRRKRGRSTTQMMAAAAAEATTTSVHGGTAALDPPEAGKRLGPDPYARIGVDSSEALERQRRLLESARSMHQLEVDDEPELGPDAVPPAAEDMTLSGLLGSRLVLADSEEAHAPQAGEANSEAADEGNDAGKKTRNRTWRLISKE